MTTFPRSPRTHSGAIVAVDLFSLIPNIILFQYNPETLNRTLTVQMSSQGGETSEVQRFAGPPEEQITVTVEFDATDQLEQGDEVAREMGVYPQLSALEMLIYPKTANVLANIALAETGSLEIIPPDAPLTLFIWGKKRVLPVQLNSFSIDEEAYDTNLNPIRAKVSLGMRVLNYTNLPKTNLGHGLFLAHQITKEVLGGLGSINNLGKIGNLF